MSVNAKSKEYRELVSISESLQQEYMDENKIWEGSPFEWIKYRPSRSIGARARVPSATPGGFALSDWPVERASAGG